MLKWEKHAFRIDKAEVGKAALQQSPLGQTLGQDKGHDRTLGMSEGLEVDPMSPAPEGHRH